MPAFWSHAETSQSAPSAAGSEPPVTKPKNRGPAEATRPGSAPRRGRRAPARPVLPFLAERSAERRPQLPRPGPRADRPLGERLEVVGRMREGAVQRRLVHGRDPRRDAAPPLGE